MLWRCNAYGLKPIFRFVCGLLSSANVIDSSDTECWGLDLLYMGECRRFPQRLAPEPADPSYLHILILSAAHIIQRNWNLTMCCPAGHKLIDVAKHYAHCRRVFTFQLRWHNCIIIIESASATVDFTIALTYSSSIILPRITSLTQCLHIRR